MTFFKELKERNVVKVAIIYIVTGWLLIQVATAVFPHFGIPDWAVRLVVLLIALGFPIALIMAWALELTPEGIVRAESSVGEKRIWTISAVLALAAIFWFELGGPADAPVVVEPPAATSIQKEDAGVSIAVLPFIDLSQDKDQEYFALGMSEELLNVLAQIEQLAVASRTSAFAFQDSKLSAQEIGQALEVHFVLEGSIRKAGDTLRITAQLIDTETDRHLWSDTYDRSTADIFKVQDEIAQAIVEALKESLDIELENDSVGAEAITANMNAYELYLVGREAFNQRDMLPSIAALERAVELDPEFARGWAQLAASYVVTPGWIPLDRPYLELGLQAADKALALDDSLGMAHMAKGAATIEFAEDATGFIAAMRSYQRGLELEPDNPTALMWNAVYLSSFGYFDQAAPLIEHCIDVDPGYFNCLRYKGTLGILTGEIERGMETHLAVMQRFTRHEQIAVYGLAYLLAGNDAAASLIVNPVLRENDIYAPDWIELVRDPTARPKDRERLVQQLLVLQKLDYYESTAANGLLVLLGHPELVYMGKTDAPWFWLNVDSYRESGLVYQHLHENHTLDAWDELGPPSFCRKTGKQGIDRYRCDFSRWETP